MASDPTIPERVAAVVERRLGDPSFDVGALARALGMSRSRLHRHLVEDGGAPPGVRIRRARLARAGMLLRTTERRVRAIAEAVGYRDPAHFTRSFKREHGVTPSTYRARGASAGARERIPRGSATNDPPQRNGKGSRRSFNRGRGGDD